jgi:hypothetical protein
MGTDFGGGTSSVMFNIAEYDVFSVSLMYIPKIALNIVSATLSSRFKEKTFIR